MQHATATDEVAPAPARPWSGSAAASTTTVPAWAHGRTGFRILGPLSVTHGDEVAILPVGKPTALLAALLLHPNVLVSAERLKQAVWGDVRPATANPALHTCVRRLRRVLADHGLPADTIAAVSGGYRIAADADTLDLIRFRDLTRAARSEPAGDRRLRLLRRALEEWQGPLLANVGSEALHRDEVPLLTEERLTATEQAVDLELEAGRFREVLAELWGLTRAHPERERLWEQLIEALYRSGRQAEALAEYRGVKGHLQDELGVDPGPALQRLELAILRGDRLGPEVPRHRLAVAGPEPGDTAAPAPRRTSLPRPLATVPAFTGRAALSARMLHRLDRSAGPVTVLVSGAPGIGKSALALHVAAAAGADAAKAAVRMTTPTGDPRPVEDLVAELDGAGWPVDGRTGREGGPGDPAGDSAGSPVGRSVLVLDDVVDADAALLVLDRARPWAAVLTSRQSLPGLAAHRHVDLVCRPGPFAPEESVEFLTGVLGADRARREPEAVQRLADVCRHFPLALRLAATRLLTRPLLAVSDYVDWLAADPVPRLSIGVDARLSLGSRLASALGRLPEGLAESFLRLGAVDVPVTGLAPDDLAAWLHLTPDQTADTLERLADAGFLEQDRAGRFHLHDLLHDYAAAHRPSDQTDQAHTLTHPRTLRPPRPEETPDEYRAG